MRCPVPDRLSGATARKFVALFSEAERAAASGVALFAPVVVETGEYTNDGHGSAADWLGALAGSSSGAAKGRLAAAARAAKDPLLTEALHEGDLSTDQLKLVSRTTAEVPEATGNLLELVEQGSSHQELCDAATRMRAASRSSENERLRRARVHANRHVRWHQVESGGIRGEFFCDEVAWARVAPGLEAQAKRRWKVAGIGRGGGDPSRPAGSMPSSTFWAGHVGPAASTRATATRTATAAATAARTRAVERAVPGPPPPAPWSSSTPSRYAGVPPGDELCEIEGIGPVSVPAATELLSDGGLHYLVKEGFDIRTVTRSTRDIARCIDMALIVRDRVCARARVRQPLGLERDHRSSTTPKAARASSRTSSVSVPAHHEMKSDGGWRLNGRPGTGDGSHRPIPRPPGGSPGPAGGGRPRRAFVAKDR